MIVLAVALLVAQGTLSGTVTDSLTGLPPGKVEVVATHPGASGGDSTVTDPQGHFVMVDVEPGSYQILAKRNGYLDSHFGEKKSSHGASTVTVADGQKVQDLNIKLAPFGVISGAVRDTDGEPLANIEVSLRSVRKNKPYMDGADTNDQGEFRFSGLRPGKYLLTALPLRQDSWDNPTIDHSVKSDAPRQISVRTFFPGEIEVGPGARVSNRDITLLRSPVYRIAVHIDAPAGLRASAFLIGFGEMHSLNNKGDFEARNVPPGNYRILYGSYEPAKERDAPNGYPRCETTFPVIVSQSDISDVRLTASTCGEVFGHITPKDSDHAFLIFDRENQQAITVKADGSFHGFVSPGSHIVDVKQLGALYVKSIVAGNVDVLHDGFAVGGGERIDIDVTLANDGGLVDGVVSDKDGRAIVGGVVAVIPNDSALRVRSDYTRVAFSDPSGHFEIKGLAPGDYKVFAWDDIEEDSWLDPDVIKDYEARGKPLTATSGDHLSLNLTALQ